MATRRPGTWVNQASRLANAAPHPNGPCRPGVRTTMRHADLAAEHVAALGGLVGDLIHGEAGEIDVHDLGDGAQAGHRRADGRADDGGLGDRRVDARARRRTFREALGDAIGAAVEAHLLAHDDHDRDRRSSRR